MAEQQPQKPRVTPRDQERRFLIHELFFSTTDRRGVITSGNDVFVRVSGYPLERLLGAPHNIIRHPDMPRCVFKLLWDTVLAGEDIAAYVKNMAADGCYYWVLAVVTPIKEGFLSIRLKPSGPYFSAVKGAYEELVRIERAIEERGGTKAEAMEASTARLVEVLKSLGFASYEELMHEILTSEVGSRKAQMSAAGAGEGRQAADTGELAGLQAHCRSLSAEVANLFARLDAVPKLREALGEKTAYIRGLGWDLQRLSLNGQVRSAGLKGDGRTLQVVAEQMSASSRAISRSSEEVCACIADVSRSLKRAAAEIATSDLSVEMMDHFLSELASGAAGDAAGARHRIAELAEVVAATLSSTAKLTAAASGHVGTLEGKLDDFIKQIRTMEILHITGRVEAVRSGQGSDVSIIFEEVYGKTKDAREKLGGLAELVARARIEPPQARVLRDSLAALGAA